MQISGLMTGLDTQSIVKQLMQVERLPGERLVTGKTKANALSGALARLNGLVKTMADAAHDVTNAGVPNLWTSQKATSSNAPAATVSALTSAPGGSTSFTVTSVAAAGGTVSGEITVTDKATSFVDADFQLTFRTGSDVTLAPGATGSDSVDLPAITVNAGTSLDALAKQINDDTSLGLSASVVQVADGAYRLQVVSKTTGANTNVAMLGDNSADANKLVASASTLQRAADTVLHFGDATAGYDVKSRTKTVTGLLEGVTVTAVKADANPVTVDVTRDVDAMASKVEAMVKAANEALSNIRINSKADLENKGATKADGTFVGNSTTRDLTNQITNVFVGSATAVPSMAGVSLGRDGTITFDKAKFTEAYAKEPDKVAQTMATTAENLERVGKAASNSTDGMVTVAIRGADALQKGYTDQIKRFEDRMTQRQAMLERQYNALDSMLSKLKAQNDWLAGQLKSLPTTQSNND